MAAIWVRFTGVVLGETIVGTDQGGVALFGGVVGRFARALAGDRVLFGTVVALGEVGAS